MVIAVFMVNTQKYPLFPWSESTIHPSLLIYLFGGLCCEGIRAHHKRNDCRNFGREYNASLLDICESLLQSQSIVRAVIFFTPYIANVPGTSFNAMHQCLARLQVQQWAKTISVQSRMAYCRNKMNEIKIRKRELQEIGRKDRWGNSQQKAVAFQDNLSSLFLENCLFTCSNLKSARPPSVFGTALSFTNSSESNSQK